MRAPERLLALHDDRVDEVLAGNGSVALDPPVLETLHQRARVRSGPRALARTDLTTLDEASLYLFADEEHRARIRHRVAASALFQRPHLPFRLSSHRVEALLGDARRRGGLRGTAHWRLQAALGPLAASDRGAELLAPALRALCGGGRRHAHLPHAPPDPSHSVKTVFALVRSVRTTARPTALALVEAILGESISVDRVGRHQPLLDPSGTPARHFVPVERRSPEERQRQAG